MKKSFLLILMLIPGFLLASPVDSTRVVLVMKAQLMRSGKAGVYTVSSVKSVRQESQVCLYVASLSPVGYMVLSADDALPPVIAYSYQNDLDSEGRFLEILKHDITQRMANAGKLSPGIQSARRSLWEEMSSGTSCRQVQAQQWPPDGTTSTGGWLETNWTQSAPYNQMCPMDTVTDTRSYVGCPATAMAQILNFHRTTNNTHFTDADDYYHNYAGRRFNIDDDFSLIGFPSFPQLNVYLDSLNAHYLNGPPVTNQDAAALSFACGVAATQVFTSAGSGTFSVNQAMDAYLRFGCTTAELLPDGDTNLYKRLAQNMKDTLPAHLAVVDAGWTTGHNVVVDGYNTDNYFHVNFGWGGASNGWYQLPDQFPYSLTVIEGLIVDIMKDTAVAGMPEDDIPAISFWPNPSGSYLNIDMGHSTTWSDYTVYVHNIAGQLVYQKSSCLPLLRIETSELGESGVYIITLTNMEQKIVTTKKVVVR